MTAMKRADDAEMPVITELNPSLRAGSRQADVYILRTVRPLTTFSQHTSQRQTPTQVRTPSKSAVTEEFWLRPLFWKQYFAQAQFPQRQANSQDGHLSTDE